MPQKRKRKAMSKVERLVGCKAGTGVDDGGPVGTGTIRQEKRGQAKTAGGLRSRHGFDNMGTMGSLNWEPIVYSVES